jgi:nuclear transport factor 2 (NTF2) superfamily protein
MEEARNMAKYVESLFNPWNIDAIVDGFTDDCVVRFGDIPEFVGKEGLRNLLVARCKRQKDYILSKTLRSLMNNVVAISFEGKWRDTVTGQDMSGWGCEIWQLRDGKIAVWEAAFCAGPVGAETKSIFT